MRRRTRARETAMQFLYQLDLRGESLREDLDSFLDDAAAEGLLRDADSREFARRLIVGTLDQRAELDALITKVARNWQIERMATVDRNVLRMATYELLHCREIPAKVVINEAIEVGKRFSTANTGGFINGILDRIRIDYVDAGRPASARSAADGAAGGHPAARRGSRASAPVTAEQALDLPPPSRSPVAPLATDDIPPPPPPPPPAIRTDSGDAPGHA